ncbi:protein-glutamate O-methyltransferase CheR [Lederbergia sp. NSJ-179]|uniref:CheR family methyltransferase n=1 Tax=Lederbergia sp. NSJ-179 TaxID=2931402 RepID=UPI001FD02F25|nr:protein-glutamate O-methyltransferase CheR [Lederbergia sp. NSJ-179]MCJ7839461.1 protein-glutamate O-methyltransferase CheR [Lederbergia sp. NSJ-179]
MNRDYENFISLIKGKTGIDLSLYKEAQMKRRLTSLFQKKGYESFQEFYEQLNKDHTLLEEFLDRMTINVTEFYRNRSRWDVLENKIFPRLLAENQSLKIWSSASSTGEEPYTISMVLSRFVPLRQISILATDIDDRALEGAKRGIYAERSLAEIPSDKKKKYFVKDGSVYKISDEIKKTVNFKRFNLLSDHFGTGYHLIVCRNVLIYFTEEAKSILYHKFSQALAPGGVLFVGSTEQIFNCQQYGLEAEDTFFYKKISNT